MECIRCARLCLLDFLGVHLRVGDLLRSKLLRHKAQNGKMVMIDLSYFRIIE